MPSLAIEGDALDAPRLVDGDVGAAFGQNTRLPVQTLQEGAWGLLQNMEIGPTGRILWRRGREIPSWTGPTYIDQLSGVRLAGMIYYRTSASSRKMLIAYRSGGTDFVRTWDGSSQWLTVNSGSPGAVSFAGDLALIQAGNKVYFFNGVDKVRSWDGTTYADEETGAANDAPPRGKVVAHHLGRLYVSAATSNPSRIFYSDVLDYGNGAWDRAANWIEVAHLTGADVVALVSMRNQELWVFTTTSIHVILTSPNGSPAEWQTRVIDPRIGCGSGKTVVPVGEDIYFMDQYGQVRTVNRTIADVAQGSTKVPLSEAIYEELEAMPKTALAQATAVYHEGRYYLSVSSGGSYPDRVYTYETNRGAWAFWTGWNIEHFIVADVQSASDYKLFFFASDTEGQLYQFGRAFGKDHYRLVGAVTDKAIAYALRTRGYTMDLAHQMKLFTESEVIVRILNGFATSNPIVLGLVLESGVVLPIANLPFIGQGFPTFDDPLVKNYAAGGGLQFDFSFVAQGQIRSKHHLEDGGKARWAQLQITGPDSGLRLELQNLMLRAVVDNYDLEQG